MKRKRLLRTSSLNLKTPSFKQMECSSCGCVIPKVSADVVKATCSYCLLSKIPPPVTSTPKKSSGRPVGWHFMLEFVDKDGTVYHRGVERPELKGTLPPTIVTKKPKKRRSSEEILLEREMKKRKALKRAKRKLKKNK